MPSGTLQTGIISRVKYSHCDIPLYSANNSLNQAVL